MDFQILVREIEPKLKRLARILNDPSVNPTLRRAAHRSALETIGQLVYDKAYNMTAWDYEIAETLGRIFDREIAAGLAMKLSNSIATGDSLPIEEQLPTFLSVATGAAQFDATDTAGTLGKYRRVTRRLRGKGDCDWCRSMAGVYTNPGPEVFRRHNKCDCHIEAEGFKSRNGEVQNYRNAT